MPKRRVVRHEVIQPSNESYRLIPLTQNQNSIVDATDYEFLSRWNWYASWRENTQSFYAYRVMGRRQIGMHAVILGCGPGEVDHKNHDTLDNRKENLRKCTTVQNKINSRYKNKHGYRGVSCIDGYWIARIMIGKSRKYLGSFKSSQEAARAYDVAAKEHHGQFANLNFP